MDETTLKQAVDKFLLFGDEEVYQQWRNTLSQDEQAYVDAYHAEVMANAGLAAKRYYESGNVWTNVEVGVEIIYPPLKP